VFGDEADSFLKKRGIHLVGETFEKFVRTYIAAKEQAEKQLMKHACNDYSPDPEAARFPSADVLKKGNKVPALAMSARYADEAELAPKMRRAWGAKIRHFVAFIKHDDLDRLPRRTSSPGKTNFSRRNRTEAS
jgi:hypothetical protein